MCNFGCKGTNKWAKNQRKTRFSLFVRTEHKGAPHIGCPFSLITSHFSLITSHSSLAKRCFALALLRFALAPRLLRAEGPSAPCAWLASAVRVTLDVSAAKLLHCHCGSRIQPSVSHFSLITSHFITSHSSLLTYHFSLITSFGHFGHLVICQNRKRMLSKPPL